MKGLHLLVRQIEELQEKNSALYQKNLSLEAQLEESAVENKRVEETCAESEREKNELQEEIIKLRTTRVSDGETFFQCKDECYQALY